MQDRSGEAQNCNGVVEEQWRGGYEKGGGKGECQWLLGVLMYKTIGLGA